MIIYLKLKLELPTWTKNLETDISVFFLGNIVRENKSGRPCKKIFLSSKHQSMVCEAWSDLRFTGGDTEVKPWKALTKLETAVRLFNYHISNLFLSLLCFLMFLSIVRLFTALVSCLPLFLWLLLGLITVRKMIKVDPPLACFFV